MAAIESGAGGERMRAPLHAQIERNALRVLTHLGGVERAGVQRVGIGAGDVAIGIQCAAIGGVTGSALFDEFLVVLPDVAIDGVAPPHLRISQRVQRSVCIETMVQLHAQ